MARSQNLVIMFTDIVGYTARTSQQSRAENEALLREHDRLLLPIVARFRGRRVKSIGDALLVVFHSPTDAVRCGMAMQDATFEYNKDRATETQLHIRVALNLGEVRVDKGDVFGEAVNIAARVESMTPADEVYFSESVYLAMNKAEVPSESMGKHELKGIPEAVQVYRVPPFKVPRLVADTPRHSESLPFGGMHKHSPEAAVTLDPAVVLEHAARVRREAGKALDTQVRALKPHAVRLRDGLAKIPRKTLGVVAAVLVVLVAGGLTLRSLTARIYDDLEPELALGHWDMVERRAEALAAQVPGSADASVLLGHVAFGHERRKEGVEHYAAALAKDASVIGNDRLLNNLVEALGWVGKPAQELLQRHENGAVIDALAERAMQPGYWGRTRALETLRALSSENEVDVVDIAMLDLKDAPDCGKRREAVLLIREQRAERAVPLLREVTDTGLGNRLKNGCLLAEAQATIAELGGE